MGIARDSRHKRRATGAKRAKYMKKRKFEMGRPAAGTRIGPKRVHLVRARGGTNKYRALRLETGNFAWGSETITRKTRIVNVSYNATSNELVRTKTLVKGCIVQVDASPFRQWYESHYALPIGRKKRVTTEGDKKDGKGGKGGKAVKGGKSAPKKVEKKETKKEEKTEPKKEETKKEDTTTKKETKKEETKKPKKKAGKQPKVKEDPLTKKRSKHLARKIKQRSKTSAVDTHLNDQFSTGRLFARVTSRPGQSGRCDGYVLEGQELAFYLRKIKSKK